jgi:hypothetical protein
VAAALTGDGDKWLVFNSIELKKVDGEKGERERENECNVKKLSN